MREKTVIDGLTRAQWNQLATDAADEAIRTRRLRIDGRKKFTVRTASGSFSGWYQPQTHSISTVFPEF